MNNIHITLDISRPVPIVIEYEDEADFMHGDGGSFCSDLTCPCHEDVDLLAELAADIAGGLLTLEEATYIASGQSV